MKIIEIEQLTARWEVLQNEPINPNPYNAAAIQSILHERLDILHRLNELGEVSIDNLPIVEALEQTNFLLRETDFSYIAGTPEKPSHLRKLT
jgi:hypothetical protein